MNTRTKEDSFNTIHQIRTAGRVGTTQGDSELPQDEITSTKEFLAIYQHLYDLQDDKDHGELSQAISYGIKIFGVGKAKTHLRLSMKFWRKKTHG